LVQSLDDRKAARHQRAKDLRRARRALWAIKQRLGRPRHRDLSTPQRKVAAAIARARPYLHATLRATPQGLDLRWQLDRARLHEDAQFDGIYALVSNLAPVEATPQGLLRLYKEQALVEGRFRAV
jgi:hypothetical protein